MILNKQDMIVYVRAKQFPPYKEGEPVRIVAIKVSLEGFEGYSFFADQRFIEAEDGDGIFEQLWAINEATSGHLVALEDTLPEAIEKAIEVLKGKTKEEIDGAIQKVIDKYGPLPAPLSEADHAEGR